MKRQQEDGVVMRRQERELGDHEAGEPTLLQVRSLRGAQQEVGRQHGQHGPERVGPRLLAVPQQERADRRKEHRPPRCGRRRHAPPHQPPRQHPHRGHKQGGAKDGNGAQHEHAVARRAQEETLQQEGKEGVLVDRRHGGVAVADPEDAAEQLAQPLFGALQAQALVPPQVLGVEQDAHMGIRHQDQPQQQPATGLPASRRLTHGAHSSPSLARSKTT